MIALIDYNMGNLGSVAKALDAVGANFRLVSRPDEIANFEFSGLLLPGVGNFGDGMENIRSRNWDKVVLEHIRSEKPFLGICLGMQMLLSESEEAPGVSGLGVFPGKVKKFPEGTEKVPHMGWNSVHVTQNLPGLENLTAKDEFFYFVHSFYAAPEDPKCVVGTTHYILDFAAALGRGKVLATQFHPEKSQLAGLRLLKNFVALCAN